MCQGAPVGRGGRSVALIGRRLARYPIYEHLLIYSYVTTRRHSATWRHGATPLTSPINARATLMEARTVEALADTFRVLGDPTRVRMLDALAGGELCVCDIAALVGISESAVSHQLRLLRGMRLVRPAARRAAGLLRRRRSAHPGAAQAGLDARRRIAAGAMSTCHVCELHAESTFKIEGMDCHEEVAILERRLKRLSGLEALDADVIGQRLRIKYDAAKLSTGSIAEAVAQTGMRAWLEHEEPAPVAGFGDESPAAAHRVRSRLRARRCRSVPWRAGLNQPGFRSWCRSRSAASLPARRAIASLRAGDPRHQRADGDCRRRGDGARRMDRSCVGRLPLRAGPAARSARDGSRPRRDPRADGSGPGRSHRQARRTASSASRSTTSGSATRFSLDREKSCRSTDESSPATAT